MEICWQSFSLQPFPYNPNAIIVVLVLCSKTKFVEKTLLELPSRTKWQPSVGRSQIPILLVLILRKTAALPKGIEATYLIKLTIMTVDVLNFQDANDIDGIYMRLLWKHITVLFSCRFANKQFLLWYSLGVEICEWVNVDHGDWESILISLSMELKWKFIEE